MFGPKAATTKAKCQETGGKLPTRLDLCTVSILGSAIFLPPPANSIPNSVNGSNYVSAKLI